MAALSPAKRIRRKTITQISREKMADINEKILDTQTSEYYTFGESTWDLVIFIGTGALGPLGSLQTVLLAVVNVMMQILASLLITLVLLLCWLPGCDSKLSLQVETLQMIRFRTEDCLCGDCLL